MQWRQSLQCKGTCAIKCMAVGSAGSQSQANHGFWALSEGVEGECAHCEYSGGVCMLLVSEANTENGRHARSLPVVYWTT